MVRCGKCLEELEILFKTKVPRLTKIHYMNHRETWQMRMSLDPYADRCFYIPEYDPWSYNDDNNNNT